MAKNSGGTLNSRSRATIGRKQTGMDFNSGYATVINEFGQGPRIDKSTEYEWVNDGNAFEDNYTLKEDLSEMFSKGYKRTKLNALEASLTKETAFGNVAIREHIIPGEKSTYSISYAHPYHSSSGSIPFVGKADVDTQKRYKTKEEAGKAIGEAIGDFYFDLGEAVPVKGYRRKIVNIQHY